MTTNTQITDSIIKPVISDTMLLFEGYIFNVQMHVILDSISMMDKTADNAIFKKTTRRDRYYLPRNRLWSKLQQIELQTEIQTQEVELCQRYMKQITEYVDDYVSAALAVFEQAQEDGSFDESSVDLSKLIEHAKVNRVQCIQVSEIINQSFELMKQRIHEHEMQLQGKPMFAGEGTEIWGEQTGVAGAQGITDTTKTIKKKEVEGLNSIRGGDIANMETLIKQDEELREGTDKFLTPEDINQPTDVEDGLKNKMSKLEDVYEGSHLLPNKDHQGEEAQEDNESNEKHENGIRD